MTATYPTVTDAEFPNGLLCIDCDREIEPGQPYVSRPSARIGGDLVAHLVCVECGGGA